MRLPISLKLFAFGLTGMILVSVVSAFAAGISVPYSNVDERSIAVTAQDLKPAACAGLYLTNIISGSGVITGTYANDLIIASAGVDTIAGLGGDDCIIGSTGDDLITGNDGNDICIGGPGIDIFTTCEVENQ
jgi:Ca2+-binding RTX toxin-like protein